MLRLTLCVVKITFCLCWVVACSEPKTGPSWACVPKDAKEAKNADAKEVSSEQKAKCDVQVQGQELLLRLVKNDENWFLLVAHPDSGQVKSRLTIIPKRGEPIELEVSNRTSECNRMHCIFTLDNDAYNALRNSKSFSVHLTRALVRPQNVKFKKYDEQFTARGLKKAIKQLN